MTIKYNGADYSFPSTLAEITLGRRIGFYNEHGKVIDELASKVDKAADAFDKEAETNAWHLELALRTFSFYTGSPLDNVRADIDIADLLFVYNTVMVQLIDQEKCTELQEGYEWNGQTWHIPSPELLPSSKMVFNEFIHAKEIVRQLQAIGKHKWDILPYLCAIYLRKENESFQEEFLVAGNERYKLMLELPLNIAIAVGFFLSSTLNIYTTTSAYSKKEDQKASARPATSTAGDGKPS